MRAQNNFDYGEHDREFLSQWNSRGKAGKARLSGGGAFDL